MTADTSQPATLRLLVADDHELLRDALRTALDGLAADVDWYEAADAAGVEAQLRAHADFDLALLDLHMPGTEGVRWIERLRRRYPALPLAIVSAGENPDEVRSLMALGISAYIPKTDSRRVIRQAVELVLAGGVYVPARLLQPLSAGAGVPAAQREFEAAALVLTPRQRDVMELLGRGLPNKLIARQLGLSEATVKVHLLSIYRALGVRNRTEAVVAAQRAAQGPGDERQ